MRPLPKRLTPIVAALCLAACGKPTSQALFTAPPQLEESPEFRPLAMRQAPQPTRDQLVLSLEPGSTTPDERNVVNSPGARSSEPDARPSVIISVPAEATMAARRAAQLRQQGRIPNAAADSALNESDMESFRTDGYYNQAEQQVETALLRRGFNVLDRAKFEAQLREMRDRADVQGNRCWGDICDVARTAGFDVAMTRLKKMLEDGEVTLEQYQSSVAEMERQSQRSAPGQRRVEDEMIDIAEVIRAVQLGEDQADYLLQINDVRVEPSYDRQFNIGAFAETRAFLERNPGLTLGSAQGQLPSAIPAKWFRATFNAKLMDVRTGSIVWLGDHTLESRHAEPQGIEIRIDVERRVANADRVNASLRAYNERGERLADEVEQLRAEIQKTYEQGSAAREFETEEAMLRWQQQTRDEAAELERQYRDTRAALAEHAGNRPADFDAAWEFAYVVGEPQVSPNLTDVAAGDVAARERLEEHRSDLIRAVTSSLINTIVVN